MNNDEYWSKTKFACRSIRTLTNEMWNVWRWFGVAAVGLLTYTSTGNLLSLYAAGLLSFVGGISLFAWISEGLIDGLTEKGRSSGVLGRVFITILFIYLAIFFALSIWALATLFALSIQK